MLQNIQEWKSFYGKAFERIGVFATLPYTKLNSEPLSDAKCYGKDQNCGLYCANLFCLCCFVVPLQVVVGEIICGLFALAAAILLSLAAVITSPIAVVNECREGFKDSNVDETQYLRQDELSV